MATFIRIRERFCAALSLSDPSADEQENRRRFGKWVEPHGHDFVLEVTVTGPVNARTQCVMDYTVLHRLVRREIVNKVDHKCLNTVDLLTGMVPTAENMANIFFNRLRQTLPRDIRLLALTLTDGDGNSTIISASEG